MTMSNYGSTHPAVGTNESAASPQTNVCEDIEQSSAQRYISLLEAQYPDQIWHLLPWATRLRGPVQLGALETALSALEKRHETLRTTFKSGDGVRIQIVAPFQPKSLGFVDVPDEDGLTRALLKDRTALFDQATGPRWKMAVYRIGKDDSNTALSIVMHRIISDSRSMDIFRDELAAFYAAVIQGQDPLSQIQPLPIQYRHYSVWQKKEEKTYEYQLQLNHWVEYLKTSRPAELLSDEPRPAILSGAVATKLFRVGEILHDKLQQFCTAHNVTLFSTLISIFRATHFLLTGSTDATIGIINPNRMQLEFKNLIGPLCNVQAIRIKIEEESFEELVHQVHRKITELLATPNVPFEDIIWKLQQDRDLSQHPLVRIAFSFDFPSETEQFALQDLNIEPIPATPTSKFDLEFHFHRGQTLEGHVLYSTDLYSPETINNMISVFLQVLEQSLNHPRISIDSLPLLTDDDYRSLAKSDIFGTQTDYPRESSIIDIFRQQAESNPDKIAVKDTSTQITYSQLARESDALACWLEKYSFAPGTLIGVFSNRSCQTVIAFLGILKANLAYLPFDTKIPRGRLEAILSSLQVCRLVLLGSDTQPPGVQFPDIEFIYVSETLNNHSNPTRKDSNILSQPTASSLAYVLFTSGSTGEPKGVMVEHRGVVRLVKQNNAVQYLPPSAIVAHMTNLAFDPSQWEIYSAILNGSTLICIDSVAILEPIALCEVFRKEAIQVATFTPALLKYHLLECPNTFTMLDTLYVGGDRADAQDLFLSRSLMKGAAVINLYGPTENSVISTVYYLSEGEKCVNGVPIGRALSNSGTYIMDKRQNLVPVGVVGELVLTGDGIAVGYTNPQHNINKFVTLKIGDQWTRAYRTGDYGRYRPTDGQLEFFGRSDGQVKIRGHRVELGEIEQTMRSNSFVGDAVVVLNHGNSREPQLVGFVTSREATVHNSGHDHADATEHVKMWQSLVDTDTYLLVETIRPETIGRDYIGWKEIFSGGEIKLNEMDEWLDDTIETIATILIDDRPHDVLEIGTGTGMILFNLAKCKKLLRYTGIEPSKKAVDFVHKAAAELLPELSDKVHIYEGTAADVGRLDTISPSLVIINSVAQCFPSQEYLFKLIKDLVQLQGVETLFFGDIRSYALYNQFLASKILRTSKTATKYGFRQEMTEMARVELELMIDPAFFTALPSRLPGLVRHVEILPKTMRATNELSCYRYAAIVHIETKREHRPQRQQEMEQRIYDVREDQWIDFMKHDHDRTSLLQLLQRPSKSPFTAISNIPYSKTIIERYVVEALNNGFDEENWLLSAREHSQDCPSMSAADLSDLAQTVGCRVKISWARQYSQHGGFDAIFYPHKLLNGQNRTSFRFPTDGHGRPSHVLCNQPLLQQSHRKIKGELRKRLQSQLPSYMVPQTIHVLNKMPMNKNGKVDRQKLAQRIHLQASSQSTTRHPSNALEQQMQKIWADVLNIEPTSIGLDSGFLHLGGNSILAMRVASEARKIGLELTVADVFRQNTLIELTKLKKPIRLEQVKREEVVLIQPDLKTALFKQIDSLGLDINSTDILDILPLTSMQEAVMPNSLTKEFFADYIYFDLGADVSIERLKTSCNWTLERFPILRAYFLYLQGKFWQVVLHQLDAPLQIHEIDGDLDQSTHEFYVNDLREVESTKLPVAFVLLRHKTKGIRLIIRMSHAQYDGISFLVIIQSLICGYNDLKPLFNPPSFSDFLDHAARQRGKSILYWKKLLQGSSPTAIDLDPGPRSGGIQGSIPAERIFEKVEMESPRLPSNTTLATLVSSAWAVILQHLTGNTDILYGTLVAGRNSALQGIEEVVGMCANLVPVRVMLSLHQTTTKLLESVQEQSVALGEADTLGFGEILQHCTGWPAGTFFKSIIQHQNIDEEPEIDSLQGRCRVRFFRHPYVLPHVHITSYPRGQRLNIELMTNSHILTAETARKLLNNLCRAIAVLANYPDETLLSCMSSMELDV